MFKFDFDIDDADDEVVVPQVETRGAQPAVQRAPAQPCHSISLAELIKLLPRSFSYSPLAHPLGGVPLLRRDLFDARFQLAQGEGSAGTEGEDGYVDADTDLIPGTYEGGLKSWEGGVDLVEVLARNVAGQTADETEENERVAAWVRGSRVLEVGCGTGIPSAYILRALLSSSSSSSPSTRTTIHVQDYNLPVLSLVTLPNLVLASLTALPASARTAESVPEERTRPEFDEADEDAYDENAEEDDEEEEEGEARPFDRLKAGTLDVTPVLLDAFINILEDKSIDLRFTYGDWSGMAEQLAKEEPYGLVLSAETIYAEESVLPLIDVLRSSTRRANESETTETEPTNTEEARLEDSLGALNVKDDWAKTPLASATAEPVILIAAKVLYFGVGGGLESFLALVSSMGGWNSRVHDWIKGVGRAVVRIGW